MRKIVSFLLLFVAAVILVAYAANNEMTKTDGENESVAKKDIETTDNSERPDLAVRGKGGLFGSQPTIFYDWLIQK